MQIEEKGDGSATLGGNIKISVSIQISGFANELIVTEIERDAVTGAAVQQIRWSHRGAYLFLQVRAEVVDGRQAEVFKQWYLGFQVTEKPAESA